MHRHIKIVGVLLIIQGALEALMGILLCVMGPFMMTLMKSAPPSGSGSDPPPELFGALYIGMGALTLAAGGLKIVAGIRNLSFKGRVLGFVALGSAAVTMLSCYCAPTSIALGVYGLIVYLDGRSAQAFKMGASGMSGPDILAQIEAPPGYPPTGYPPGGYPPAYP